MPRGKQATGSEPSLSDRIHHGMARRHGHFVTGLAAYANGCAIIGTIDFDVKFRPTGAPRAVDCNTAAVTNVRFQFFDQALDNLLRTEVTRPCVPTER